MNASTATAAMKRRDERSGRRRAIASNGLPTVLCEPVFSGGDARAQLDPFPRHVEGELDPTQRGEHLELVEGTEMADPEHLALEPAETGTQREVQAFFGEPQQLVGVGRLAEQPRGG